MRTASQILNSVYNSITGTLKVSATIIASDITIEVASHEVEISHVNDSIKIGDGTDLMAVNPDGSINAQDPNDLLPVLKDELVYTYVTEGNGLGKISTIIIKNSNTTKATLTFTYDSNNKVTNIKRT